MSFVPFMLTVDHALRAWVVTHRLTGLDGAMWALSAAGRSGVLWALIGLVPALFRRIRWADFARLAAAMLLAGFVTERVLKPFVHRQRPFMTAPAVRVIGDRPADPSFPSGHASNAFAAAVVLEWAAPSGRALWWTLAFAMAYSRVYLGVHYPLDVAGGAIVGLACGFLVLRLTRAKHLARHLASGTWHST